MRSTEDCKKGWHLGSKYLAQELARAWVTAMGEEFSRRPMLDDHTAVREVDAIGDLAGETHLVGHDDARHAITRGSVCAASPYCLDREKFLFTYAPLIG